MFKKLSNIGDCGIVCDFGEEVNREINTSVIKLFDHVKKEVLKGNLNGILNYTPSYNKLIINFDLEKINSSKIIDFLKSVDFSKLNLSQNSKKWTIPVCYDFEMDLENMSKTLKIKKDKIAEIDTKELVKIRHDFTPNLLPKKPEIIEPSKGNNTIAYSMLAFQRTDLFNIN